jgi:hypothetical protein
MDKTQQLEEIMGNFYLNSRGFKNKIRFSDFLCVAQSRDKFLAINENGHFWCRVRNEENNSSGNYELSKSYQEQKKETKRLLAEIIV